MNLNLLLYLFATLTLSGAVGVVFFRHFLYGILSLLLTLLSLCGLLYMIGAEILSAMLFWHLGITSILVLLHTFFLIGPQNSHKSPRRLVPGKFFFVVAVLYTATFLIGIPSFHVFKINPAPIDIKVLYHLFQTEHAFAIFLLLSLTPFILISSLLLIRQDKNRNKEINSVGH